MPITKDVINLINETVDRSLKAHREIVFVKLQALTDQIKDGNIHLSENIEELKEQLNNTNILIKAQNGRVSTLENSYYSSQKTKELDCPFREDIRGIIQDKVAIKKIRSLVWWTVLVVSSVFGIINIVLNIYLNSNKL